MQPEVLRELIDDPRKINEYNLTVEELKEAIRAEPGIIQIMEIPEELKLWLIHFTSCYLDLSPEEVRYRNKIHGKLMAYNLELYREGRISAEEAFSVLDEDWRLLAVEIEPDCFLEMKNPPPEVIRRMIEFWPETIELIKNPSVELQCFAVKGSWLAINYISDPSPEAVQLHKLLWE